MGQGDTAALPAGQYEPTGQTVALTEPAGQNVPPGHSTGDPDAQ